jgi:hypothetical protein
VRGRATHNLVDHDEHACLRVLHRLHVAVNGTSQTRVHARLKVAVEARRLDVGLLRHQQEQVGFGRLGDGIKVADDLSLDLLRGTVDDEVGVDVYIG